VRGPAWPGCPDLKSLGGGTVSSRGATVDAPVLGGVSADGTAYRTPASTSCPRRASAPPFRGLRPSLDARCSAAATASRLPPARARSAPWDWTRLSVRGYRRSEEHTSELQSRV